MMRIRRCGELESSKSSWSIPLSDLILGKLLKTGKSTRVSARATRFSGKELALSTGLTIVGFLASGDFLRILSGLSTISGGFGSGWLLVWILFEATVLYCWTHYLEKFLKKNITIFKRQTSLDKEKLILNVFSTELKWCSDGRFPSGVFGKPRKISRPIDIQWSHQVKGFYFF